MLILVSSTFLVQNNYYSTQVALAHAQDNTRAATELIASEVRSAMLGGFTVAGPRTLVVRSPIAVGVICARDGSTWDDVYFEGGTAGLDTAEVAGVAHRFGIASWNISATTWSSVHGSDLLSASTCAGNGADTTDAAGNFRRLLGLQSVFTPTPVVGDPVMVYRETMFKIRTSQMDPTTLGLFRGPVGGTLVEFATGIDPTAQFQYRTGGTTFADTITGGTVTMIDAVRLVATALLPAQTGGRDGVGFGWTVDVAPDF